jgi:hypothetical protein
MGDMRNVYNTWVGKREGKRSLGRSRHRWEDHIRVNVREVWWERVDWILLAQDRDQRWVLVSTIMNLRVQ